MQTLQARIVISATDMTSAAFARIAKNARASALQTGTATGRLAGFAMPALTAATLAAGGAAVASMKDYAQWQKQLNSFGKIVGVQGAALDKIGDQFRDLAPSVGQSSDAILEAAGILAGKGLDLDRTQKAMVALAKVATATDADFKDIANTGFTLIDTMGVKTEDLTKVFDALAQAGKSGGFELKDMAREFPSLTAQAKLFGMEGIEGAARLAAMLQIALKTAGTTDEAANNVRNLFAKMVAPETIKRLSKFGIDYKKEVKKAAKAGEDQFTHMVETIADLVKDDPLKLSKIFPDQQARMAFIALMNNLEAYKRLAGEAAQATGVITKDFERTMSTADKQWQRFTSNIDRLSKAAGEGMWEANGVGGGLQRLNVLLEDIDANKFGKTIGDGAGYAAKQIEELVRVTSKLAGILSGDSFPPWLKALDKWFAVHVSPFSGPTQDAVRQGEAFRKAASNRFGGTDRRKAVDLDHLLAEEKRLERAATSDFLKRGLYGEMSRAEARYRDMLRRSPATPSIPIPSVPDSFFPTPKAKPKRRRIPTIKAKRVRGGADEAIITEGGEIILQPVDGSVNVPQAPSAAAKPASAMTAPVIDRWLQGTIDMKASAASFERAAKLLEQRFVTQNMTPSQAQRIPLHGPTSRPDISRDLKLPDFEPGSLDRALSGKVEAEVTKPVTATLEGKADIRVTVQVQGGGQVTSVRSNSSGHVQVRTGVDTTGRKPSSGPGTIGPI